MIKLQNVSVQFQDQAILEQVSLSIEKSQKVAILGLSGSGKSVLLKTLAGLIVPNCGSLILDNIDFHKAPPHTRNSLLRRMGMAFQKSALFDSITCGENVAMPLREWGGISEAEIQNKVKEFLAAVEIPHALNLFPDEISGGMQKRLAIARALALNPEFVLYDDPTAGLDPITSRKIIELVLSHQRAKQSTMVMVTNDIQRAFQADAHIYLLHQGSLISCGLKNETLHHPHPAVKAFIRGEVL
ncbi:MAG TPA: ATP-binding cassette domain-containing protein [Pseudobdellovibrionaceae bacterium]|nr:ATP-binding cassette domain-containing protein [Pseudobdellovibrionaceae bacterium]